MELIKDLGSRTVGTKGGKKRYGLYKCPICKKHFECIVSDVTSGNTTKCRSCANKATTKSIANSAAVSFIDKAEALHGTCYDYSLVTYINNHTKVEITCRVHGVFEQTPSAHLKGQGCPQCAKDNVAKILASKAADAFEDKALATHYGKYDYSLVKYVNNHSKVTILCGTHGLFEQIPKDHLNGRGCPQCALTGFDKTKPAIVYYLKITCNNTVVYKIGITNRSVKERFNKEDLSKISIVKTWDYLVGAEAYEHEQQVLSRYKEYKYTGEPILRSGNTELFTTDVLELDNKDSNDAKKVWLLRTSTGQYLGRVFASKELAEATRVELKEAEALEGWYSGYILKEVEIEG